MFKPDSFYLSDNPSQSSIIFLFSGQGTQYFSMGHELYHTCEVFKRAFDRCSILFERYLDKRLVEVLFESHRSTQLQSSVYIQSTLFSFQYALVNFWSSLGINPDVVIGHSFGEYAAAVVSGSLKLEDAVQLVVTRGTLFSNHLVPNISGLLAISASEDYVRNLIDDIKKFRLDLDAQDVTRFLSISCVNSDKQVVIAGDNVSLSDLKMICHDKEIKYKHLGSPHAYHSSHMESIIPIFNILLKNIHFHSPSMTIISTMTGKPIQEFSSSYWCDQTISPILYCSAVESVINSSSSQFFHFIEIGADSTLTQLTRGIFETKKCFDRASFISSFVRKKINASSILHFLNAHVARGGEANLEAAVFLNQFCDHSDDLWIDIDMLSSITKAERAEKLRQFMLKIVEKIQPKVKDFDFIQNTLTSYGFDSLYVMEFLGMVNNLIRQDSLLFCGNISTISTFNDLFNYAITNIEAFLSEPDSVNSANFVLSPLETFSEEKYRPTSAAQLRSWIIDKHIEKKNAYNVYRSFILDGALNINVLKTALFIVSARHEVLRTYFKQDSDFNMLQVVLPSIDVEFIYFDLNSDVNDVISTKSAPFTLTNAPLWRVLLVKNEANRFTLDLVFHHSIVDGTSVKLFINEFFAIYEKTLFGENAKLSSPFQYSTFCKWESDWLISKEATSQRHYWDQRLAHYASIFQFPPIDAALSASDETLKHYRIPDELIDGLNKLGSTLNLKPFLIYLAAYFCLIKIYTAQDDLVISVPYLNRHLPTSFSGMGFFLNAIPLRFQFSGSETIHDFLVHLNKKVSEDFENTFLPFDQIIKQARSSNTDLVDLFQVCFLYQSESISIDSFEVCDSDNLSLTIAPSDDVRFNAKTYKTDLTFELVQQAGKTHISVEFNNNKFNERLIDQLVDHYFNILTFFSLEANKTVNEIRSLSPDELTKQILTWNDTKLDYPDKTLHELFEEQVKRTPKNFAVVFGKQRLTYEELNAKANQLARHVRHTYEEQSHRALLPDTPIAICVERSLEMVVGMLAILKAGGAYVAIDRDHPDSRIETILLDVMSPIILTDSSMQSRLVSIQSGIACILLDQLAIHAESTDNLGKLTTLSADHLAYLVYTSGSTGQAKGVMGTHRGMVNRLSWMWKAYEYKQEEICCHKTSLNFVDAIAELFSPLLKGLSLHVVNEEIAKDGQLLSEYLTTNRITRITLVPSLLRVLLSINYDFSTLQLVVVSGEALTEDLVEKVAQQAPHLTLLNLYGSSEVSADVTYSETYALGERRSVKIGKPIANMQIYVLDSQRHPVPLGVVGELYVAGVGVARGYLNQADLTAERFIEHRFSEDQSLVRLYKTGDLVRWTFEGELIYIGRNDFQVKIRGHRIECGEVEFALKALSKIEDAVVVAKGNPPQLVAYVVVDKHQQEASVKANELREQLKGRLPDYMLPAAVVLLDTMPLNINGKLDRRRLPDPEFIFGGQLYIAPETALEVSVVRLMELVLNREVRIKVKGLGLADNFFEVGGDSLSAMELLSRIQHEWNIGVGIERFLREPTAGYLVRQLCSTENTSVVRLKRQEGKPASLPSSFAQERMWVLNGRLPNPTVYNISIAFRLKGEINVSAINQALNSVLSRHEVLRTYLTQEADKSGAIYQTVLPISACELRVNEESLSDQQLLNDRIQALASVPFNLSELPLIQVTLLKEQRQSHVLVIVMHHSISDGWSLHLLAEEVSIYYNHYAYGMEAILPELPADYTDYAIWQREDLSGEKLATKLEFWQQELEDVPESLALPTDFSRPQRASYKGESQSCLLSHELSDAIKALAGSQRVTPFVFFLSVLKVLLYRYTQEEKIAVGTVVTNRDVIGAEKLIGFFVNTLVLNSDVKGDVGFADFLSQIYDKFARIREHQDLPFQQLVKGLHKAGSAPNRNPFFEVMFIMQNNKPMEWKLNEISVERIGIESTTAKFDITMEVKELSDGCFYLNIEYATELFKAETIKRMLSHYEQLLREVVRTPSMAIGQLALLTEIEQNQLQVMSNQTKVDFPDKTLPELFEEQVRKTLDSTAVVFNENKVTYEQLKNKANCLAIHLRSEYERCAGKSLSLDTPIAICIERGFEMVIGILAILKAGAAYVPIDPNLPRERAKYILTDSNTQILLTKEGIARNLFGDGIDVTIVYFEDHKELNETANNLLPPVVDRNSLAYIIYTSGTTGKPKGSMITHGNLANLLFSMQCKLEVDTKTKFLALTNISFDIAGLELYLPLMVGGQVILADQECLYKNQKLIALIEQMQPSIIQATPSRWISLLHSGWKYKYAIHLLSGGEALDSSLASSLAQYAPNLWNMYGPTETTIWSLAKRIDNPMHITIGHPLDNTQIYVLDAFHQPVPIGVSGELCIAGDGVSRGYRGEEGAKLMEERFIECRVGAKGESIRLYKTGDLVRWTPEGELIYIGRRDSQVKIRGHRIECGEIASAILENAAIHQAIVIARDKNSDKYLIAYFVLKKDLCKQERAIFSIQELKDKLRKSLPEYMVPQYYMELKEIPVSHNNKIDYKALPDPVFKYKSDYKAAKTRIEKQLILIWAQCLDLSIEQIGVNVNFFDLKNADSLKLAEVHTKLPLEFKDKVSIDDCFHYHSIHRLAEYIKSKLYSSSPEEDEIADANISVRHSTEVMQEDIAVIGMALRVPGAETPQEFWRNLSEGRESLKHYSDEELRELGIDAELFNDPNYVKARGAIDNVEYFDAAFFEIPAREALILDPQQRLFLECAWSALEDAGYDPKAFPGKIGLYASVGTNYYFRRHLLSSESVTESYDPWTLELANEKDHMATRVAYKLNLNGPAMTVQTACSSSLVALHQSRLALQSQDCDMALVGGISLGNLKGGYLYKEGMVLSPDGHCRAFDETASGTMFSQGGGVVLLKRYSRAIEDHDRIYAVIKGSAVNNDGNDKLGYTAPSSDKQAEVIQLAQQNASVDAASISYVEAHGTGTRKGDPIELKGLAKAFSSVSQMQACAIGSVKTNIGHLDIASGLVGFIKTVLALQHQYIPPSLHYHRPTPAFNFSQSPFFVNTVLRKWETRENFPRRAGVSSFGIGGTNAHVIVEECSLNLPQTVHKQAQWIALSARSPQALKTMALNLSHYLGRYSELYLEDVAYTLHIGRMHFSYKYSVTGVTTQEVVHRLENIHKHSFQETRTQFSPMVFIFSGQGTKDTKQNDLLYEQFPLYQDHMDKCFVVLKNCLPELTVIQNATQLTIEKLDTASVLPIQLFMHGYVLAKTFMQLKIKPDIVIGHSLGEYTAACIADLMSLEDTLGILVKRAFLVQSLSQGLMLSVQLSVEELLHYLKQFPELDVAAINSHLNTVVSGDEKVVMALKKLLDDAEINCKMLALSHAYHSRSVDSIKEAFAECISQYQFSSPSLPSIKFLSTVTADWLDVPVTAQHWVDHLCRKVQFAQVVNTLMDMPNKPGCCLEIGSGEMLTQFLRQEGVPQQTLVLSALKKGTDLLPREKLLLTLSQLWSAGWLIDFNILYEASNCYRLHLPTYPFERKRFWIDAKKKLPLDIKTISLEKKEVDVTDEATALINEERDFDEKTYDIQVVNQLLSICKKFFNTQDITPKSQFQDLGLDSLSAIGLSNSLSKALGLTLLPSLILSEYDSIEKIAHFVKQDGMYQGAKSRFKETITDIFPHEDNEIVQEKSLLMDIKEQARPTKIPASFNQRAMYILNEQYPDSSMYNVSLALKLNGPVNIIALKQALKSLLLRHEILRTIYYKNEDICQQILSEVDIDSILVQEIIDIKLKLPSSMQKNASTVFDLSRAPLWKVRLLKQAEDQYGLLLTFHHSIIDGWSLGILSREMSSYYNHYAYGSVLNFSEFSIQYADYSIWQRKNLQDGFFEKQLDYWASHFEGAKRSLEFPTDKPRPKQLTHSGSRCFKKIDLSLSAQLKHLANISGNSLYVILLSAFKVLLYRYSQQDDIVVGTVFAKRDIKETRGLMGFFANTIALRTQINPNETFISLLAQVKQTCLLARQHQDIPFEVLLNRLSIDTELNKNPLFQMMFVMQNDAQIEWNLKGIEVENLRLDNPNSLFDLTLEVFNHEDGIKLNFEYSTELFLEKTVKRLINHFEILLLGIVSNPEEKIAKLPLLSEYEVREQLITWNQTARAYPQTTLHEMFEKQVEKTPNATALVFEGHKMSYDELNARANQVSHYLRNQGVGPDQLVGLGATRSLEMIVGILAILKAGGAYVPFDSAHPDNRLHYMLKETQVKFVLTQSHLVERWERLLNQNVFFIAVPLDEEASYYVSFKEANLESITYPNHLAYIIYTSGTSGEPKGVMVEHHAAINLISCLMHNIFHITPETNKVASFAPHIFDVSVAEYFVALTQGAELHILSDDTRKEMDSLSKYLLEEEINYIYLPPSVLSVLPRENYNKLEGILTGIEKLDQKVGEYWSEHYSLYNYYGPTETTVCSTGSRIYPEYINTIGVALFNTQLYILNDDMQLLFTGAVGELYIGGAGLARGYLNPAKLKEERFIWHKFSEESEPVRLYRTGDLVRYLLDGNIEYIGRKDHQVKIRGYRIELGEIEALLSKEETISSVAVLARGEESHKQLIAYIVSPTYSAASVDEQQHFEEVLRSNLSQFLPDYMVPTYFQLLDSMPLTINDKVDRKLLEKRSIELSNQVGQVSPRNALERLISQAWQSIVDKGPIGIYTKFSRSGADSIKLIQIASKLTQRGYLCKVNDLYLNDTIADLALCLQSKKSTTAEQCVLEGSFDLLTIQQWFFRQNFAKPGHWNQSFLVKVPVLSLEQLKKCLQPLVQHHDVLRIRFYDQHKQHYLSQIAIPDIKVLDVEGYTDLKIRDSLTEWQNQFDITHGPLFQIGYLAGYEDGSARLYFAFHHLIIDTVSWRILIEDIKRLYEGQSLGIKSSSYRQWVNAVSRYIDRYPEEETYWNSQLISEHASYALGAISYSSVVEFDIELTKQLLERSSNAYKTEINDILLTALGYALSTHLGSSEVWICLEGHGREVIDEETDVSRTVGWFTIQYPVCLRVQENIGESIQHIKETLRAIPRKGIGFSCFYPNAFLPDVTFNYLGQFDRSTSDWQVVRESSGRSVAVENSKPCYLTMNGAVIEGKLHFQLDSFTSEETVEALGQSFKENLSTIVSHCVSQEPMFSAIRRSNYLKHLKLFLIHDIFGYSSNLFHNLVPYLTEKNISCIDHPYFKDSNFLFSSFQGMISYYFSEIKKQQPHGPYFLGGWSFGGMVAFELAKRLSHSGDQIAFVIMFDSFINESSVEERRDYFLRNLQKRAEASHAEVQEYLCKPYENNHTILKDFQISAYSASKVVLITSESTEEEINFKNSFWARNVTYFETVNTTMSHENFFDKDYANDSALIINSIFRKYKENQAAFIIQAFLRNRDQMGRS